MLAHLAALQLLVLVQADPAARPPPDATDPQGGPAAEAPTPPSPEKPAPAAPAEPPEAGAAPARGRQLSLLSGESLAGGSTALAWVGWTSLGAMYGQGIGPADDLAGVLELDWVDTELRLGALYRRALGRAGSLDLAARLGASWYRSFGSSWIDSGNHSDYGLELAPGAALSARTPSGVFSMLAEAPLTVTMKHDAGLLFRPRLSVAYEAPVYGEVTVGARLGVGYRAGAGDAPLQEGRGELVFLVLAGYQLL